jgi:hypothetical protein
MALRDLSLSDWAHMGDEMARGECEAIAQALPRGATFNGLKAHAYCGREYRIARFRLGDGEEAAEFVLVPGGEASVGFDGRDFRPSEQQLESFARSAEEYWIDQSIREFVNAQTSAARVVYVAAMLVEVEAREIGVEQIGPDDPAYGELCRKLQGKGGQRANPHGIRGRASRRLLCHRAQRGRAMPRLAPLLDDLGRGGDGIGGARHAAADL